MDVSVVLPIFNEEGNLLSMLGEIDEVLRLSGKLYEIICVDDFSTDRSVAVVRSWQQSHTCVRLVRHRLNCGQSAAVASGFGRARGDIVVTLDADGQNDPADIPRYLEALKSGVDCVCGVRKDRQDPGLKQFASRIANRFRNWLTHETIEDAGCGFRAVRRRVLCEVPRFNGMHRFLPTLLRAQGYTVAEVPIRHRPRMHGVSKYGIHDRLWRGIRDCFAIRWYQARAFAGDRLIAESVETPLGEVRQ